MTAACDRCGHVLEDGDGRELIEFVEPAIGRGVVELLCDRCYEREQEEAERRRWGRNARERDDE